MSKIQLCRNGCGKQIQVMQDPADNKWKPYEQGEDNEPVLHDCPKSPYNQKKQQGGTAPQKQEDSSVHYQILQELRKTNEFLDRSNRLLGKIAGVEE